MVDRTTYIPDICSKVLHWADPFQRHTISRAVDDDDLAEFQHLGMKKMKKTSRSKVEEFLQKCYHSALHRHPLDQ
ncbi:hypothetical protein Hanom_Chr07g00599691 [Helianthus anomalus]